MTSSSLEPAQNWRGAGGAVKSVKAFRGATSLSRAPCGFHIKLCAFQECRELHNSGWSLSRPGMAVLVVWPGQTAPWATST